MAKTTTPTPQKPKTFTRLQKFETLFSPNKIADESKIRISFSESEGVCRVHCLATGIGSSFRISSNKELFQFVKAEHAETMNQLKRERDEKLKKDAKKDEQQTE